MSQREETSRNSAILGKTENSILIGNEIVLMQEEVSRKKQLKSRVKGHTEIQKLNVLLLFISLKFE